MNDKLEIKLKELLPYIIITAILYLLLPLFMGTREGVATYLIQIGAFPLTALGCGFHYAYTKNKHELYVCGVAPVFYALTALLYGMWRDSWYTVLIYIAAYFICGYLGLMLADIFKAQKGQKKSPEAKTMPKRKPLSPKTVDVKKQEAPAEDFKAEDPAEDISLDTSTTDDDIEAILAAIHNRKS